MFDKGKADREEETNFEWFLKITRVLNGYYLENQDKQAWVIEDDENDELKSGQNLLWGIMNQFSLDGSKHDAERLRVVREKQEKDV